jgi:uncharacterized protein YjbI with pentapeptide repeats
MADPDGNPTPTANSPPPECPAVESSGKRAMWIVSAFILLLLGGGIGAVLVLSLEHLGSQTRFYGWMAILAAVAAALLLVVALIGIVRWLWRHRGQHSFVQARGAFDSLMNKPATLPWAAHLSQVWQTQGRLLLNALFVTLVLWAGVSLLSPLMIGLFSFASYLSSQAQVQVTDTQNRIVAIEQEFQQANAYAEQRFEQISKILLNVETAPAEQAFALREVPEAICITVPRAVLDESGEGGVSVVHSLPNLRRLRDVVRQYISMDRVTTALRRANLAQKEGEPLSDAAMRALEPLEATSTELFHLLHRLGPPDATKPDHCLWGWPPTAPDQRASSVIKAFQLAEIPASRPALDDQAKETLDFSHLNERDMERAVAPWALNQTEWRIISNKRLSFKKAKLQGASFKSAVLNGADFSYAQLQKAGFSSAELQRTDFRFAQMQGAWMRSSHLQGAFFVYANLQQADLMDAKLQGAQLIAAQLQEARLHDSHLQGANLMGAECQGGILQNSNFQGADMSGTRLQGAYLGGSQFQGGNLNFVRIAGEPLWFTNDLERIILDRSESEPTSDATQEAVEVLLPGAWIDSPAAWLPKQVLQIKIEDATAFIEGLKRESEHGSPSDNLAEKLRLWSGWLQYLSPDSLGKLPWPQELEPIIQKLVDPKNITKEWRGVMLVLGIDERIHFSSAHGAAWVTTETRDALLRSLESEPYLTMTKKSANAARLVDELRQELTNEVNHPGKFPNLEAWEKASEERKLWSLKKAYVAALKAKKKSAPPSKTLPVATDD